MTTRIEPRSFVAGVACCLLMVGILGANANQKTDRQIDASIGRFQLRTANTSSSMDAFVVDTVTGQVWQKGLIVGATHKEFYKPKANVPAEADDN
jgi:hypothetical protein